MFFCVFVLGVGLLRFKATHIQVVRSTLPYCFLIIPTTLTRILLHFRRLSYSICPVHIACSDIWASFYAFIFGRLGKRDAFKQKHEESSVSSTSRDTVHISFGSQPFPLLLVACPHSSPPCPFINLFKLSSLRRCNISCDKMGDWGE